MRLPGVAQHDATGCTSQRGDAPLIVSFPACRDRHSAASIEARLVSPWLAPQDADWWVAGSTTARRPRRDASVRTDIVAHRDRRATAIPSGASLYPGQATTEPVPDRRPSTASRSYPADGAGRGTRSRTAPRDWFDPYHAALGARSRGCAALHTASCSTTATRSARVSRACSTACCRTSISAPTAARAATRRSTRRSRPLCDASRLQLA